MQWHHSNSTTNPKYNFLHYISIILTYLELDSQYLTPEMPIHIWWSFYLLCFMCVWSGVMWNQRGNKFSWVGQLTVGQWTYSCLSIYFCCYYWCWWGSIELLQNKHKIFLKIFFSSLYICAVSSYYGFQLPKIQIQHRTAYICAVTDLTRALVTLHVPSPSCFTPTIPCTTMHPRAIPCIVQTSSRHRASHQQ